LAKQSLKILQKRLPQYIMRISKSNKKFYESRYSRFRSRRPGAG
jgi:hypothetical protein